MRGGFSMGPEGPAETKLPVPSPKVTMKVQYKTVSSNFKGGSPKSILGKS